MRITLRRLAAVLIAASVAGLLLGGTPGIGGASLADEPIEIPQELPWLPSPEAAVSCDATQTESPVAEVGGEILDLAALSGSASASCDYCTSRQDCYSVCGSTEVACVYYPYCGEGRFCACFF